MRAPTLDQRIFTLIVPAFAAGTLSGALWPVFGAWLAQNKDAFQAIQALVTSAGIVAGAIWFYRRRQAHPRVVLTQQVTHRPLGEGRIWVRVTVSMENKGNVLVAFSEAKTLLQQVVPLTRDFAAEIVSRGDLPREKDGPEIEWRTLAECTASPGRVELEPDESDTIAWDFVISERPKTIIAYTHLPNATKSRPGTPGWTVQTVYDLTTAEQIANPQPQLGTNRDDLESDAEGRERRPNGGRAAARTRASASRIRNRPRSS
jgi:hypothetical protein